MCIFDVMMPKKDGFTLAKDVRKVDQDIPILFLTAKNQTEDKIEGFKAGGDDYFVGRSLDVFITKLRKYLKEEEKVKINNIHGVGFKLTIDE